MFESTTVGEDEGAPGGAAGWGMGEGEPKSELVRLAVQRVVEELLEAAVRDLVGREYRPPSGPPAPPGVLGGD